MPQRNPSQFKKILAAKTQVNKVNNVRWLGLLDLDATLGLEAERTRLGQEAAELTSIFGAILQKTK